MLKRNVVLLTVVALVLGVGAYAWAQGEPERPTTTAPTDEPQNERTRPERRFHRGLHGRGPGIRGRAVHGDLIVRTRDGFENVTFDKGEVAKHDATSLTLERADGVEVTKQLNADTKFKGVGSADELVDGRPALVVSRGDAAVVVGQRAGDSPERPR